MEYEKVKENEKEKEIYYEDCDEKLHGKSDYIYIYI